MAVMAKTDLRDDVDIRLLREFSETAQHLMGPGDVLYVPPGVGHWGTCNGDSVTLSVGIRNPTLMEFIADLSEFLLERTDLGGMLDDSLYPAGSELPATAIGSLGSQINAMMTDQRTLRDWYGEYVTRLREPDLVRLPDNSLTSKETSAHAHAGATLRVSLPSRLSYARHDQGVLIYANGTTYQLDSPDTGWLETLTADRELQLNPAIPEVALAVLTRLINDGVVYF